MLRAMVAHVRFGEVWDDTHETIVLICFRKPGTSKISDLQPWPIKPICPIAHKISFSQLLKLSYELTMITIALVVASFISLACSSLVARNLVVHESRQDVPDGFVQTGSPDPTTMLNLRIALVQSDMAGLEEALFAVSTPDSALYGQHLSKDEVRSIIGPYR